MATKPAGKASGPMDLKNLDSIAGSNEGAELEIVHPRTDEGTGIFLTLYGPDSDVVQRLKRAQVSKTMSQIRTRGTKKAVDPEALERDSIEFLARATKGWRGVVENGKEIEFSRDAAADLYARFPFIREQADRFIGERAHFMRG